MTSRTFGFPVMLLLLTPVAWVTMAAASVPSSWLASLLIDTLCHSRLCWLGAPGSYLNHRPTGREKP